MIPDEIFLTKFWNFYLTLEEKFIETMNYVELSPANFLIYNNEYATLMHTIGAELDNMFKLFCFSKYKKMEGYKKFLVEEKPNVLTSRIKVRGKSIYLEPFDLQKNLIINERNIETYFWWDAYNIIKHKRYRNEKHGNLRNTLYLLAALYCLEIVYTTNPIAPYLPTNESKLFIFLENNMDIYDIYKANSDFICVDTEIVEKRRLTPTFFALHKCK